MLTQSFCHNDWSTTRAPNALCNAQLSNPYWIPDLVKPASPGLTTSQHLPASCAYTRQLWNTGLAPLDFEPLASGRTGASGLFEATAWAGPMRLTGLTEVTGSTGVAEPTGGPRLQDATYSTSAIPRCDQPCISNHQQTTKNPVTMSTKQAIALSVPVSQASLTPLGRQY